MDQRKSTPRKLQKSIRYPTYQLYAAAASERATAEEQLVLGALSVLRWVREKLSEFDIPAEFQTPLPEAFRSVGIAELKSGHIEAGYDVETICLPEIGQWAFRLIEPDLSTKWEDGKEISTAVPGRIFETNIAFAVYDSRLYCGVKVVVSEPENTTRPCLVLRPAVVQELAENPDFGLRNRYPIQTCLWDLDTADKIKRLSAYLREGTLPAVVFCDYSAEQVAPPHPLFTPAPRYDFFDRTPALPTLPGITEPPTAQYPSSGEIYDTERFAGSRMGYVQSFRLKRDAFERFEKTQQLRQLRIQPGDILFMEPREFGGAAQVFRYSKGEEKQIFSHLMELSRDYMRRKAVNYGRVLFLTEMKLRYLESLTDSMGHAEVTAEQYEERIDLIRESHREQLEKKNEKIEQQANKITRLTGKLQEVYAQMDDLRSECEEQIAAAKRETEALRDRLQYFLRLSDRPKTPQEIPGWVAKAFPGRMIFYERASRLIAATPPNKFDMKLLCDALEYLATEYRDQRTGLIAREEANAQSADKYGRPFEVTPCGKTATEMSADYKIKYKLGYHGKPVETLLDLHLKVGNTNGNQIRIYFLYDNEKKLIVVGSLPEHLKAAKIKG